MNQKKTYIAFEQTVNQQTKIKKITQNTKIFVIGMTFLTYILIKYHFYHLFIRFYHEQSTTFCLS